MIKGKEKIDPHVRHVDLNDSSIDQLGLNEFDRSIYGRVVNVLTDTKVNSIAFDIFFATERDKKQDEIFVNAVERSNAVFLAISPQTAEYREVTKAKDVSDIEESILEKNIWHPKIITKGKPPVATTIILNFEKLSKVTKGFGHISIDPDEDGVFRRIPLLFQYKNGYIPSLTFSMIAYFLKINPEEIEVKFGDYVKLKNAKMPLGITKDIKIPIDISGSTIINFTGKWADRPFQTDFATVLSVEKDREQLENLKDDIEDTLVVISDITTRGKDHGTIPLEKVYPKSGLHSNLINSILTNTMIQEINIYYFILLNLLFVLILWILSIRFKAVGFTILSLTIFSILIISTFFVFAYYYILVSTAAIIICYILSVLTVILYQYFAEQKNYISYILKFNQAAEKFVPKEFLHFLNRDDIIDIALGDQIFKKMTIVFSDIRSFTTISEKMTPKENFDFINSYLSEMGPIIRENNGFIDKYIGDAIMALFSGNPENAVKAAISMKKRLAIYNKKLVNNDKNPIEIGLGINTGDLMLGIIGENERFEGSVISDSVNLASRLEGLTKFYHAGIIISETTYLDIKKENYNIRFLDFVKVKGKNKPVSIYEILDGEDEETKKIKLSVKNLLDDAFKLYLSKDFEKALSIYNKIINDSPKEELAQIFKKRCEHFIKQGAPENWNGSIELLEK